MPFGFLRRKAVEIPAAGPTIAAADAREPREVGFEGLTDEWRLRGRLVLTGRLLDALNQRDPLAVTGVDWRPADGSGEFEPAPGIHAVDPYDLVLVIGSPETLAPMSEEERAAHRVRKVPFDVLVEAPPYRVLGTLHLHPGTEPGMLLDRQTLMWFALTEPVVQIEDASVELDRAVDCVLINRFYIRGIDQVDRASGEKLPSAAAPSSRVPSVREDETA